MRTRSLPRLVGVLTVGAALSAPAQSIGPLKETWDGGKTWHPEGSRRPNQPAPPPNPPTPEEIAQQQAAAAEAQQHAEANTANEQALAAQQRGALDEAQRLFEAALAKWDTPTIRQNLADNTNKLAIAAQQRGDIDTAARQFEQALANWDHPVIRQNLENVQRQLADRRREQQEWHDAPVVAKMHAQLQQLGQQFGARGGSLNFDSAPSDPTAAPTGLDFVGLPPKTSATAPAKPAELRVPAGDTGVVDLSGAKSSIVDPRTVKGTSAAPAETLRDAPNAVRADTAPDPRRDPLFAAVVHDATVRDLEIARRARDEAQQANDDAVFASLFSPNDQNADRQADATWQKLVQAEQVVRDLRTQKQTLEHEQLLADMQRIRQDPALGAQLEAALQRIHRDEADRLKLPSGLEHAKLALQLELKPLQDAGVFRDSTDLLTRAKSDPRIRVALDRAHASVMHDQADALRDSTDELARVVEELKHKLPPQSEGAAPSPNGDDAGQHGSGTKPSQE